MADFVKAYDVPAPLASVYAAWISDKTLIPPATALRIDARVGGTYRIEMGDAAMEGTLQTVLPEEQLVYSWQWDGDDEATEVDVRFAAKGDGTEVTIEHRGFRSDVSLANHIEGWDAYIEGLTAHLTGGH